MYRYMDIGTAKPDKEEMGGIPHHFIDFLNPDELYTSGQFETDAEKLLAKLFKKYNTVIVVGGSTLYIRALWEGMDEMPKIKENIRAGLQKEFETKGLTPLLEELQKVDAKTFKIIDQHNHVRVIRALEVFRSSGKPISFFRNRKREKKRDYKLLKIGLKMDRQKLYERINHRVDLMMANGLEEEVRKLLDMGYQPHQNALNSIGYEEIISFLEGKIDKTEAIRLIKRNSRRYAKRQFTYFRRFEDVQWFETGQHKGVINWLEEKTRE